MPNKPFTPLLVLILIVTAGLACSLPDLPTPEADSAELQTLQAVGTNAAQQTAAAEEPVEQATDSAAPTDSSESAEPSEEPTVAPTIEHTTFPSSPGSISSFMTDRSTRPLASERRAIADNFDQLLFERPYSSEAMEYKGYLDLTRGELSASSPWFYVILHLEEAAPAGAEPYYGVEIDVDKDGRGDWLIWGQVPADSDWTTDGVQALQDTNNDVGGGTPVIANNPPQSGDGYDDLVFDAGIGLDPDSAWIRRSPSSPTQVQLAFKQTLIGASAEFLWGVWADEGPKNPAFFDYNDHWSPSQAGSPVSNSSNYPVKELAQIDNSCRWGYGFQPDGSEPGACFVPPTPTPTASPSPTPEPGRITGLVYRDQNNNQRRDSGEDGLSGATVTVRRGSCSGGSVGSSTTGGSGSFSFDQLSAGTYCVTVDYPTACFDRPWIPSTSTSRTITIGSGETGNVSFGYAPYIC